MTSRPDTTQATHASPWILAGFIGAAAAAAAVGAQVTGALGVALFLMAAAYGYGRLLARWLDLGAAGSPWQSAPLLITAGWTSLIMTGLVAGTLGWLAGPVVVVIGIVGCVLAVFPRPRLAGADGASPAADPRSSPAGGHGPAPISWWWGLAVLLLIGMVGAVAPDVRYDALAVHLPIAREFAHRHAIVEMPHNTASYHNLNAALLYAMGMTLVQGEMVPKLMHFLAGVTVCLLVYDVGTRLWTPRVGLAAAAAVAGTPFLWWLGGTTYTDLWVVLFTLGAVSSLILFLQRPGARRGLLVGLMTGAAVGTKITAVIVAAPVTVVFALIAGLGRGVRRRGWTMAAFLVGAAATGAFWHARAWVLIGNPVFPFLGSVFAGASARPDGTRFVPQTFGMGSAPWDLLLIPWRVTWFPDRFAEDASMSIGIAYLVLLPFAVAAIARGRVPRWIVGVVVAGGLFWFFTAQYLRFLLPVLPLAALIGAAGLFAVTWPRTVVLASAAVLALSLALTAVRWVAAGPPGFPWPVASRAIARSEYAATHVEGFRVARYAARVLPASARIYGLGEDLAFHYDRFFLSSSWHGRVFGVRLRRPLLAANTGSEAMGLLERAGFTHLVLSGRLREAAFRRNPNGWIARETFWEEGPWLEYAYREYYLFRLSARDRPRSRGPQLLANVEMAPGPAATPTGWQVSGSVQVVQAPEGSGRAGTWARVASGGHLLQQVPVKPDGLFSLEAEIRSAAPGGQARLFIQWMGPDGRALDYTTWRKVVVGPQWKRYAMACTAPPEARTALIWLIAAQGDIEFDNAGFYELR